MVYTLLFSLQNAVCFIILTYLVPLLFTFYIQGVLKLKKNNSGAKGLNRESGVPQSRYGSFLSLVSFDLPVFQPVALSLYRLRYSVPSFFFCFCFKL